MLRKMLLLPALLALSLSACATAPGQQPDDAVAAAQRTIEISCAAFPVADAAFQAFAGAFPDKVDASARKWEAGVVQGVTAACAIKPDITNYASIVKTLTAALLAVSDFVANNRPPPT